MLTQKKRSFVWPFPLDIHQRMRIRLIFVRKRHQNNLPPGSWIDLESFLLFFSSLIIFLFLCFSFFEFWCFFFSKSSFFFRLD